jgi:integrase
MPMNYAFRRTAPARHGIRGSWSEPNLHCGQSMSGPSGPLMVEGRTRDLAMFNLAIDSKLRGCDVVALKVEDVATHGYTIDRATVRQRKTGRPVKFELTEQTRQAVDDYLAAAGKKPAEFLFTGHRAIGRSMTHKRPSCLMRDPDLPPQAGPRATTSVSTAGG